MMIPLLLKCPYIKLSFVIKLNIKCFRKREDHKVVHIKKQIRLITCSDMGIYINMTLDIYYEHPHYENLHITTMFHLRTPTSPPIEKKWVVNQKSDEKHANVSTQNVEVYVCLLSNASVGKKIWFSGRIFHPGAK